MDSHSWDPDYPRLRSLMKMLARGQLLRIPLVLGVIATVLCAQAVAAVETWESVMVDASQNKSISGYLKAIPLAEKFGAHDPRLHVSLWSAAAAVARVSPKGAEPLLRRDIAELERLDINFPELASAFYKLAMILEQQNRYEEADALIKKAIGIRNHWHSVTSNDPYNAQLYAEVFVHDYLAGRSKEADEAKQQMWKAIEQLGLPRRRVTCLGFVRNYLHEWAKRLREISIAQSVELSKTSYELGQAQLSCLEKEHITRGLAESYAYLAEIAMYAGLPNEAEQKAGRALILANQNLSGVEKVCLLELIIFTLSECYEAHGRAEEADRLQQELLSTTARECGTQSARYRLQIKTYERFWQCFHHKQLAKKWERLARAAEESTLPK